ncbi:MAG: hypothetical protein ACFFDI_21670 [Promethearchaeota archaeon]
MTTRISIRTSLASASIVNEQESPLLSSISWRLQDEVGGSSLPVNLTILGIF